MTIPSDEELTRAGAEISAAGSVPSEGATAPRMLLIACGALARELLALIEMNGWSHLDLRCLPAILHNTPEKIPAAVEAVIEAERADYDRMFVVYADCGTGGHLEALCQRHGVELMRGPHCYSFFEGHDIFAAHSDEVTTFYLTDFLARQFDAFVWKPLGLDRHPELLQMYFGNYEKLVFLAQTEDAALTEKARAAAERLGLAFERRMTGYGDLETEVSAAVQAAAAT